LKRYDEPQCQETSETRIQKFLFSLFSNTFIRVYSVSYLQSYNHTLSGIILAANCTQFRQRPIPISICFKNFTLSSAQNKQKCLCLQNQNNRAWSETLVAPPSRVVSNFFYWFPVEFPSQAVAYLPNVYQVPQKCLVN
jgi:hypothetical protein